MVVMVGPIRKLPPPSTSTAAGEVEGGGGGLESDQGVEFLFWLRCSPGFPVQQP